MPERTGIGKGFEVWPQLPHDRVRSLAYAARMTLRFPVASNADAALQAPLGFAMRELEARAKEEAAKAEARRAPKGPAPEAPE